MKNCKVEEGPTRLPDGSGFMVLSFDLPEDHWCYQQSTLHPPAPFKIGTGPLRDILAEKIREAGKYAYQAAGCADKDHDPDAFLQNLVVGLLGYWTETGDPTEL